MVSNDWSGRQFPHPPRRIPVAGDFFAVRPATPIQDVMKLSALGSIFEIKLFGQRLIFVTTTALAAELCDEMRFEKANAPSVEALRAFAGDGLFTAHNDEPNWKLAHDLLVPAFARGAMRRYHPMMLEVTDDLLAAWDRAPGYVDVPGDMTRVTLETIGRAGFSQEFGSFERDEPHPFVAAMVAALVEGRRAGAMAAVPGARVLARLAERSYRERAEYLKSFLDDIITARQTSQEDGPDDLLGLMLNSTHPQTGERLDEENIRYQILTFLVAGHETTSGALSFALYYLTQHPEILRRATAEVDAILGPDPDEVPTFEQVAKFRYLRRVLDEALRLWPTAPAFARSPRQKTTLGGRYAMGPEDYAILLLPQIQRDPAAWGPHADKFDPDRFLPEHSRGRPPHAHKVFGTGERSCIGRQFALHEAVLVLARLLHRYDLAAEPGYQLKITERLTLIPEDLRIRAVRREPETRVQAPEIDAPSALTCPHSSAQAPNGIPEGSA